MSKFFFCYIDFIKENTYFLNLKYYFFIILILFLFLLCLTFIANYKSSSKVINPLSGSDTKYVTIYLSDGFENPGIYKVSPDTTLAQILQKYPNTYTNTHQLEYDLNSKVFNNQTISIKNEVLGSSTKTNESSKKPIYKCTKEDLKQASGVGDKTADKILLYVKNNKINNLSDLDAIQGVGEKTINEISKYCY